MVSGIDSSAVLASGNLNVLKKAMESEEALMGSIINGMQGAQSNLQTQTQSATPAPQPTNASANTLDIMA
ncbi:hypothetical protein [Helicobacter sp. MIT 05-5294]|uniref:hypothetical protein n=1 Tax=Helicobacter sp. MIT 05-5294 TaxID=1548150 RepID=UPI00051FEC27|nr:hypothetical protein [Helicobacter sp. MIT 05-5294]TLD85704.1 hypothetical protein LS69_008255 [Helicobacter sp. MIT 05-5294]